MKKIYTLLSLVALGLLALSNKAAAQITVTSADMPSVGTTFVTAHDTTSSTLKTTTPGAKGASATWDFHSLTTTYRDTDIFVNPSSTPYASSFSGANLADSVFGTAGYNYLNASGTAFSIVGSEQNVQGVLVAVVFNPPITEVKLPAHYNDINSGSSRAVVPPVAYPSSLTDSVKGSITVTYVDTMDAYGTLKTPLYGGTSYSTLRQKHYELDIDSIFIHTLPASGGTWNYFPPASKTTKNYQYRWFANSLGDLAATMQMDTANKKVTSFQWYSGLPNGINEISQAHYTLAYPNPATNQITFRYSAQNAQNIFVYDMTGRQIGQAEMKSGMATLNTSAFASGIYFYHVTDKSGNVLDNGKFSVL